MPNAKLESGGWKGSGCNSVFEARHLAAEQRSKVAPRRSNCFARSAPVLGRSHAARRTGYESVRISARSKTLRPGTGALRES